MFYVWFDAPIEYIAATAEWAEANGLFRRRMGTVVAQGQGRRGRPVCPVHGQGQCPVPYPFLSGDDIRIREPWKLVDYIKSFNYLNYDGGSSRRAWAGASSWTRLWTFCRLDYWRWWLLAHAPEHSDSEFTWENFVDSVNKDLADVLGNYASRTTKFCRSKFGSAVPEQGTWDERADVLADDLDRRIRAYEDFMDAMEVRKSAQELRAIWAAGNEFLQTAAPWSDVRNAEIPRAKASTALALNLLRMFAVLSKPFIPDASETIMRALGADDWSWPSDARAALRTLEAGHEFSVPDNLFNKISEEERDAWRERFAGAADA